jgi:hypothetical protein
MLMLFVLYKCISQMWCFQQENKIRVFFRMPSSSTNFKLLGFPVCRFRAYLMKVIPETRHAH